MHRQLAVLTVLLTSAFALPPMRRDGAYPSVIVKNNIDVNIQGAASGAAPAPPPAASGASYGGINVGVNVDDSISYGGENIDVDTHIEVDVNGNECEVNSSGVTVKTKINGVWYDSNSLPSSSTNNYVPSPSVAPENHNQKPAPAPASSQPAHQPWKQNEGASYHPRPTSSSSSTTSTTSSSTTPAYHHTPPTHTPTNTPYFISGEGVMGISWDQFTLPDQACKSESEITDDINQLVSYGYQNIRLYGPECNAIDYALSALNGTGTNLIVGLFSVTNYTNECSDMISQVNGRWDLVEYVSVFNEAVNDGLATIADVETAIAYVKAHIPDNTVPVTTIDTFSAFIANPDLCNVGADFIACNCQPYFSAVAASDAGAYVLQQQQTVAQICNVNSVDITESGWPASGQTLGAAIPSFENQYIAVQSIINALNGSVIVFEAFDDLWKAAGPNGVENSFVLHLFGTANFRDCIRNGE